MAKTKAPSKHSRAARRATSPSINTDKSLKDLAPPKRSSAPRPSVLDVHRAAGVTKKTRPVRKSRLTSKMRRRHERGLEMAEAVTERTGKKLERSLGKARVVAERSRKWEDVNRRAGEGVAARGFGALADEDEDDEEDEDDSAGEGHAGEPLVVEGAAAAATEAGALDEDEDEIL